MNILITPDVHEWAIGNLTKAVVKHNKRFNFFNIAVHPRGVITGIQEIKSLFKNTEIHLWHARYWNSALKMMNLVPELKEISRILTHHNHESLEKDDSNGFDTLVGSTDWGTAKLQTITKAKVFKIPYGVDLDRYSFIEEYPPKDPTIGYVGRVLPHKNLDKICKVANKLGYNVVGCGYIEKPEFWDQIPKENLQFNGGLGREGMATKSLETEIYRKMTIFVMYSTGEKESGTIPLLEAMARGIPVMATRQGMARDIIEDGRNGILFDEKNFEENLKMLMETEQLRNRLRQNAWQTIKNYSEEKMARDYAKIYYKTLYPQDKLISIIIPTFNRADNLLEVLLSIEEQNYPAKEIIVCDDGSTDYTKKIAMEAKKQMETPILYIETGTKLEYGLAKARNIGAIEALGDILVFLDDRLKLKKDALMEITMSTQEKTWHWGGKIAKGKLSNKKSFIENFSWIRKEDFVKGGMFSERITGYGGISQETRARFGSQGFNFRQVENAVVETIIGSARHKKRNEIWRSKFILHKMYDDK